MKKAIWLVVVLIILGLLVWAGAGSGKDKDTTDGPIKIGADLPMTGIAANYGEHQKNAISMAVEEINNSGGVNSKHLEVIYEDNATDAKQSVSVVQKLISVDNVHVIIGGTWDFLAGAIMPVINSNKRILITPSASQDMIETTSQYHFSTYVAISNNRIVVEKFLSQFNKPKVAIVYANNYWGQSHRKMFKDAIEKVAGSVVKETVLPKFDNNDIQRELALIKSSGADVIVGAFNYNDSISFAKRRSEFGITAPVLSHANFANAYYDQNISSDLMKDIYVFRPAPPTTDFETAYTKRFGKAPLAEADSAYDAVYAIKYAIEESGKSDAESILTGLRKVSFNGASGRIDYPEFNYPVHKLPILQKFDGSGFVEVK